MFFNVMKTVVCSNIFPIDRVEVSCLDTVNKTVGDIAVFIAKLISTLQRHIFNSKHYKPCKFSEITKIFTLLRVKSKDLHFRINWDPFPVTSSGSCTHTYLIFITVVTKPRKSGYEYKARYHVRT